MLATNKMDVERVAKAIKQYNQRLEIARRTSHRYYHRHQALVNAKRVVESIRKGRTPTKASVEKYDRDAITEAWLQFVLDKSELSNRQKTFHAFLTGSEWVPICECV